MRNDTPKRWRLSWVTLVIALLAFFGMLIASYPTVASWLSQYAQSKVVENYQNQVDNTYPDAVTQLRQAHEYNDALSVGALLEADTNKPTGSGTSSDETLDYDQILRADANGLMARLKIPAIDVDLPVLHGTSDETLLRNAGHLRGTSLPVGGENTHAVITAHRGLADARLFTDLDKVQVGDRFVLEVFGEVLTYEVRETKIVEPSQTESLRMEPGEDLVTLVTCTPLGINTHRILVTGVRVTPTPIEDVENAGAAPEVPHFPWWAVWLPAGTLLIGAYVWYSGFPPGFWAERRQRRNNA
ncbi:sortase [Propionibacterium sp. oral taxon 192 str. F0372]|uniref:class C sortase n=1 Tax=Propionibacterium sp. oral taxon 192 TaxID=671222 RepID=UPI000352C639|nr:class C sortase [Propionibacterium sp. oral taxon 192]EPH03750.1 sortase [Propionibacterium sp. oral taxon 192 str. F0372]